MLPGGTPSKYKERLGVRRDLQTEGINYFIYAPFVQWSTVPFILTMVLSHGCQTKHVDYTNAFTLAKIQEEVYIEPPKGFRGSDGLPKILKILKSLYGLKQAHISFFDKLKASFIEQNFIQSEVININS